MYRSGPVGTTADPNEADITMKRSRTKRTKASLAILSSGMLFTGGDLSCAAFGLDSALLSTNFCFLLNCNEGALGGLIDFCSTTRFRSFIGGMGEVTESPFLADCPET